MGAAIDGSVDTGCVTRANRERNRVIGGDSLDVTEVERGRVRRGDLLPAVPRSAVRSTVPLLPLAQATFPSTASSPRSRASMPVG
jgi:hypothetical protein